MQATSLLFRQLQPGHLGERTALHTLSRQSISHDSYLLLHRSIRHLHLEHMLHLCIMPALGAIHVCAAPQNQALPPQLPA